MYPKLHFRNLEPTHELRHFANQEIGRILDLAPYGSSVCAVIEKQLSDFRCSIDIYSVQGPFAASAVGVTGKDAILSALGKLAQQVQKWKQARAEWNPNFWSALLDNKIEQSMFTI